MKHLVILLFLTASSVLFSQNSIVKKQMNAMDNLNAYTNYFGKRGTTNLDTKFSIDRNTKKIFYNSKHKQSRYVLNGKTYYNMTFHVNFYLKDVTRVYESGNKIFFNLGSRGFTMRVKSPGENWTKTDRIRQNMNITIYDASIRKKVLKDLRFLVKHPTFLIK